ncbi:MAG: TolC family outer membrane protein [Legionellaceae bacterium]|nr:TolC family outer membrane protein [Legionellaceae bacterium]
MPMKRTTLYFKRIISGGIFFIGCHIACATDLMDVYRDALANDPTFKQAYSTYMANREALPQATAALLPQVLVSAQAGRFKQHVEAGTLIIDADYDAQQWQINATQTLFNYQSWMQVQKAKASVKAAQATFNSAAQDLLLRTSQAYLDILLAQDTLRFAEAKKAANQRQYEQASERFKVGIEPITSVYEAKAGYDQSVADLISARNREINRNENLRKLTNHVYEYISPLRNDKLPLIPPEPNRVEEWIATGIRQNYALAYAKYSMEAARENIKAQTAGNWPTLSLQGNTTNSSASGEGTSSFFIPAYQRISNASLLLNFPIYQGGLVASQTRQAKFQYQTSSEQYEQSYRNILSDTRITFNTVMDGISKVEADRQTVISRVNSLDSTTAQFEVGTRTMVDVVNATQRLFESRVQLASDQYGLIDAELRLKYLAGTLNVTDLQEINAWLNTLRVDRFPPPSAA